MNNNFDGQIELKFVFLCNRILIRKIGKVFRLGYV